MMAAVSMQKSIMSVMEHQPMMKMEMDTHSVMVIVMTLMPLSFLMRTMMEMATQLALRTAMILIHP